VYFRPRLNLRSDECLGQQHDVLLRALERGGRESQAHCITRPTKQVVDTLLSTALAKPCRLQPPHQPHHSPTLALIRPTKLMNPGGSVTRQRRAFGWVRHTISCHADVLLSCPSRRVRIPAAAVFPHPHQGYADICSKRRPRFIYGSSSLPVVCCNITMSNGAPGEPTCATRRIQSPRYVYAPISCRFLC
jgi:hypothetical protein